MPAQPNEELFKIIRANVRTPDETIGDLYAQASSNAVGARSLLSMMEEFGLETIDPLADEIIQRSETAMRSGIRELPNGCYSHETWSDGFEDPIRICVAVTVEDEDILIDFAGSSPQSRRGINVVLNYTKGYASFAMKAAISPDVPHNEGAFRPVQVTAPEGSILNCVRPAAVASRHLVGHFLPSVIFGALAKAIPNKVIAGSADPIWMSIWRAKFPNANRQSNFTLFMLGGTGARSTKDGLNTTGFPSGVGGVPTEVFETQTPLIQQHRQLRDNSGGPGKFRGGLGQETSVAYRGQQPWSVSGMVDRVAYPANGLGGGGDGKVGEFMKNGSSVPSKTIMWLEPSATMQMNTPGGGGFHDPLTRDAELVLRDVIYGYISIDIAKDVYGVVIEYTGSSDALVRLPEDYVIDEAATAAHRAGG